MRIFSWMGKYVEYFQSFYPETKRFKKDGAELRFAIANRQGRVSATSTVLPIWVSDSFKPVRARLIGEKTELLPGIYIVSKPDIGVEYGFKRFMVGRGELEMIPFNEKHHFGISSSSNCLCLRKTGWLFWKNAKIGNICPGSAWGILGVIWKFGK